MRALNANNILNSNTYSWNFSLLSPSGNISQIVFVPSHSLSSNDLLLPARGDKQVTISFRARAALAPVVNSGEIDFLRQISYLHCCYSSPLWGAAERLAGLKWRSGVMW